MMIAEALLIAALTVQPGPPSGPPAYPYPNIQHYGDSYGYPYSWTYYGQWATVPPYGWVWVPRVWRGWQPYYYGVWVWHPVHGMMWFSFEPWGDICYHYGRWVWVFSIGWSWVPGYEWGPAWVYSYEGDDYFAWAPLDPSGFPSRFGGPVPSPGEFQDFDPWATGRVGHMREPRRGEAGPPGDIAWVAVTKTSFREGQYRYLKRNPAPETVDRMQEFRREGSRPFSWDSKRTRPHPSRESRLTREAPRVGQGDLEKRAKAFIEEWRSKAGVEEQEKTDE
jgi:hypothetical protein